MRMKTIKFRKNSIKKVLIASSIILAGLTTSNYAQAYQDYETLKEDARILMSNSLNTDLAPKNSSFENPIVEALWIDKHMDKVKRYSPDKTSREDLLKAVHYEAVRAGLEPEIVLGLMKVESGFNKYAISSVGARGLMQIMPFWVKVIGSENHNLFDIRTNLRYGCLILRHYLEIERGDMFRALGRYNGSLGKAKYPDLVVMSANQFRK